jgi:1-phosphofructokinase family hexose kinase
VIVVGGFNTALDKLARIDAFEPGGVIRLRDVRTLPGGKGFHVALACATLGAPATLVGIIDDASRDLFERALSPAGARFVWVTVSEPIRTCLALVDANGRTTELLDPGAHVLDHVAAALSDSLRREANRAQLVVLSGSLPSGLPADTYATLIEQLGPDRVLLDSSGAALEKGIAAAPMLVKPNRQEAEHITGFGIRSIEDAVRAAAAIGARGPRSVLVSLGSQGAVMWTPERTLHVSGPEVTVRNSVGAGDCLLAGFATSRLRGCSIEQSARFAVACGTAKVLHPDTGVLRAADVENVVAAVAVTELGSR